MRHAKPNAPTQVQCSQLTSSYLGRCRRIDYKNKRHVKPNAPTQVQCSQLTSPYLDRCRHTDYKNKRHIKPNASANVQKQRLISFAKQEVVKAPLAQLSRAEIVRLRPTNSGAAPIGIVRNDKRTLGLCDSSTVQGRSQMYTTLSNRHRTPVNYVASSKPERSQMYTTLSNRHRTHFDNFASAKRYSMSTLIFWNSGKTQGQFQQSVPSDCDIFIYDRYLPPEPIFSTESVFFTYEPEASSDQSDTLFEENSTLPEEDLSPEEELAVASSMARYTMSLMNSTSPPITSSRASNELLG
jgi:hypothetical protein